LMDLGDTLATDAAQEIVKALAAGLVDLVKKGPELWSRLGKRRQELIAQEVDRGLAKFRGADGDRTVVPGFQEGIWAGRLRDLLAEDPEAIADVRELLAELRQHTSARPQAVQNITASAQGASAQGAMFGNIVNHAGMPGAPAPMPGKHGKQS
jgi:hypothetical protein